MPLTLLSGNDSLMRLECVTGRWPVRRGCWFYTLSWTAHHSPDGYFDTDAKRKKSLNIP